MESKETSNLPPEDKNYLSQINAREKIIEILTKVDTQQAYSDKLLDREIKDFSDEDRRFITAVVNGVLRWKLRLDWVLQQLYTGEYENLLIEVKNNLRSSVYQLMYLDRIPPYAVLYEAVEIAKGRFNQKTANLVNAVLRNFLRQQKKFEILETQLDILDRLALKYSHPKWMIQRWIEFWGIDEVSRMCEVNNSEPRLSVRINAQRANREAFFKILDENGIAYQVHPDFENFVWIDNFQQFRKLEFLNNGWVSVQDVSTGLPVLILDPRPGEWILDMCAAPGGKTGYLAEKLNGEGKIFAADRHFSRIRLTRSNLKRLGLENVNYLTADSTTFPSNEKFDKILIDAPCSGLGVLRKRTDLKWKRTLQDILNMQKIQLSLLEEASRLIKDEGAIVYSTCTIEPEENEQVIEQFLENHPEFSLEPLDQWVPGHYLSGRQFVRTFPHKHEMDGSFAVRLKKFRS